MEGSRRGRVTLIELAGWRNLMKIRDDRRVHEETHELNPKTHPHVAVAESGSGLLEFH